MKSNVMDLRIFIHLYDRKYDIFILYVSVVGKVSIRFAFIRMSAGWSRQKLGKVSATPVRL